MPGSNDTCYYLDFKDCWDLPRAPESLCQGREKKEKKGPGRRRWGRRPEHYLEGGLLQQLDACLRELNALESLELWVWDKALEIDQRVIDCFFIKKFPWGQEEKSRWGQTWECRGWRKLCNYMSCWMLISKFPNCGKWFHSQHYEFF